MTDTIDQALFREKTPEQRLQLLEEQLETKQALLELRFEELAEAVCLLEQARSDKANLQDQIRLLHQQLGGSVTGTPDLVNIPEDESLPVIVDLTPEERESNRIHIEKIAESDLFDAEWYLETYPDVKASEEFADNPAAHYTLFGGFEGRKPCLEFNSDFYIRSYADVRQAKANPLVHYLEFGCNESRAFSKPVSEE